MHVSIQIGMDFTLIDAQSEVRMGGAFLFFKLEFLGNI